MLEMDGPGTSTQQEHAAHPTPTRRAAAPATARPPHSALDSTFKIHLSLICSHNLLRNVYKIPDSAAQVHAALDCTLAAQLGDLLAVMLLRLLAA